MIKNNFVKKISLTNNNSQTLSFVIEDLQNTIQHNPALYHTVTCRCDMCLQKNNHFKEKKDGNLFKTNSVQSSNWLKTILDGLCLSGAKTLKLYLPDILFTQDDNLQIFQTSHKDGRITKLSNTVSLKSMYITTVRMRKQYKSLLQQNFNEKMQDNIDPQLMHVKYFDKYVPSYFHDGMSNNNALHQNKYQFKKYVLHKSKKYEIQRLQQHKMNDKQPFCIVKYKDGNCQLFNQIQFNVYSLSLISKIQEQLVFVQSYIKYKLQIQAIYYSQYTYQPQQLNKQMDNRAQQQIIILIGGKNKFDAKNFHDIQTIEELQYEMMINKPREYVKFMTYKIMHYLNMTSRIYIQHIKIKWIMNDIGNIYLQEIMEFQHSDIPIRFIKYRLPPKDQSAETYHYSEDFIEHYKDLKRRKLINTLKIKKNLQDKSYNEVIKMMFPDQEPSTLIQQKYKMEYVPLIRKGKSQQKDLKKIKIQSQAMSNRDSFKNEEPNTSDFRQVIKKQSFQSYLNHNLKAAAKISRRSKSINLDKWKNIHLYNKKDQIKQKTNSYFTINQYNLSTKQNNKIQNNRFMQSKLICKNQQFFNAVPYSQKTLQTMYRTTISFNNRNNRAEGEPNNRYNKLMQASRYNKTSKSISIV